jgi:hypothetical protein
MRYGALSSRVEPGYTAQVSVKSFQLGFWQRSAVAVVKDVKAIKQATISPKLSPNVQ